MAVCGGPQNSVGNAPLASVLVRELVRDRSVYRSGSGGQDREDRTGRTGPGGQDPVDRTLWTEPGGREWRAC